jgi:hypothetical protein
MDPAVTELQSRYRELKLPVTIMGTSKKLTFFERAIGMEGSLLAL